MRSDLAFFVRLLLPMPALCQDTPLFRANLDHTGVYGAAGVPMFTGVKWRFQTNGRVISSPAVENGCSMSVAWTRISTPSTNKPPRSSGSLLPKVRWYLLRRWRAGLFISPAMTANLTYSMARSSSRPQFLFCCTLSTPRLLRRCSRYQVHGFCLHRDCRRNDYFGTLDGKFAAVDLKTQKLLGSFRTTRPSRSCPQSRIPRGPRTSG
jgi:hypothetical protein